MKKALADLGKRFGVGFEVGSASYSGSHATLKLEIGVLNDDGKRACADKLASEFPAEARAQDLLVALDRLLGSTELNLDEMEPETVAAIVFAEAVRKLVKGEKP